MSWPTIPAALLLLAGSPAPVPRASVCDSIAGIAQAAAVARRHGVTEAQAMAAADELDDSEARAAARAVLWYVYEANRDGRVPPAKLASLVHGACMATSTSALTGTGR